jgi:hypothetical protein
VRDWLRNHGFPLLVIAALVGSSYVTASVKVPDPVPDYALQAAAVCRLEVGAACFVVAYLAAMTLALALAGRGFVEVAGKGLRSEQVVGTTDEQRATSAEHLMLIRSMEKNLKSTRVTLNGVLEELDTQDRRLQVLEKERLT